MAPNALLPGDPARALALAQELLDQPLMSNHARGLWGYSGTTSSGDPLTIQSTGIGAASGAVVLAELAGLGVERAVRLGTCRALDRGRNSAEPGDVLIAERVIALDGVSAGLSASGPGGVFVPDAELTSALTAEVAGAATTIVGVDPLSPVGPEAIETPEEAVATDLQVAALVAAGREVELSVGCVDLVVESSDGSEALDDEEVMAASIRIGREASRALSRAG